ncbi:MAG: endonuclease/exonuclease/phosphatase family protein [Gammaproteobacteria bacterium]|nr:endonuclease/exonuclease/phosphatase family protein [Gammaproteobacteria bacterium]
MLDINRPALRIALATYNLHACIGTDGAFDPDRSIKVINDLDADVLALQEVEHHPVGDQDLLDYLATKTGYTAIAGPNLLRDRRHYGNALLTRLPVMSVQRIDLSIASREPRGALDVSYKAGGQRLQVVATHLGLNPTERRQQVRQLLTHLESSSADITVLMGDINEWFLWGRPLRWLRAHFQSTARHATFPTRWPLLALDHIWISPHRRLISLEVHRSKLARIASDHLPLKAIIEL